MVTVGQNTLMTDPWQQSAGTAALQGQLSLMAWPDGSSLALTHDATTNMEVAYKTLYSSK